jgi:hypothetical protein
MTNNEAKFVLAAYRPNGSDANDPAMGEAIAQARNDPAMSVWFGRAQAHDASLAAKVREIAPPPGLRESILAGVRATESSRPSRRTIWRRPVWLGMAAVLMALFSLAAWWRFAPVGGDSLEEFAVNYVARGFVLAKRSPDLAEIRAWLADHRGPLPSALPAEFAQLRALGCRRLDYQGRSVSLVCFERGGQEFHLFIALREDFPGRPDRTAPAFGGRGDLVSGTWSDAERHYVVVSDATREAVQGLL